MSKFYLLLLLLSSLFFTPPAENMSEEGTHLKEYFTLLHYNMYVFSNLTVKS